MLLFLSCPPSSSIGCSRFFPFCDWLQLTYKPCLCPVIWPLCPMPGLPDAQQLRIHQPVQTMRVRSLGQEDPLAKCNSYPLQCSCLGNPMDRGTSKATVQKVAKSQIQLSNWACTHTLVPAWILPTFYSSSVPYVPTKPSQPSPACNESVILWAPIKLPRYATY